MNEKEIGGLVSIGSVSTQNGFRIVVSKEYARGLTGIEGFSHVQVVWFADKAPSWQKDMLVMPSPYEDAPAMGVFATRSPLRPNGICISSAQVTSVDVENGIVELSWIDAEDGTPVLDIKPYHPSEDRITSAKIPSWGKSWPASFEESGDFDWSKVFLF